MRVLMLANARSPHTRRWAGALAGRGWEVHVASIRPAVIPAVTVHRVGVGSGLIGALLSYPWMLLTVRRLARRIRPDLIHAHYSVTHGAIAVLTRLRPLVVTVWGSDLVGGDRPVPGPKRWLNRFVLRRVRAVTVASEFLAGAVGEVAGPGASVAVVPFGVDTTVFRPGSDPGEGFRVGFVKHLRRRYDPSTLVEGFARLAAAEPGASLVMAGSGPMLGRLRRRARRLGVADRIEWLGEVPHEEVPALMRTFQVLANPSRSESFGVVLAEAGATGIPAAASAVGGVTDVVVDGETGLLVLPGDPHALAAALARLAADPELRRSMGEAARRRVQERFEWSDCVDRMVAVLEEAGR